VVALLFSASCPDSLLECGGYLIDGGCGMPRVPAIDEGGGFLSPQLNQFDPGKPHPPV